MTFKIPFVTVEPVVFFCMASFFLLMVSMPQLLLENICRRKYNNETKCTMMETGYFRNEYDQIQQQSALWVAGYIGTATAITLITLPTVGVLSDIIGKRKALFLVPVFQIVQSLSLIAIVSSGMPFSTWILLIPAAIPALVADLSGLYVLATAYIAAVTSVEQRTMRMTMIDAATLIAGFTATLSSGFLIERFGYIGIYVFVIVLQILAILDLVFFVEPDANAASGKNEIEVTQVDLNCDIPMEILGKESNSQSDIFGISNIPVNNIDSNLNKKQSLSIQELSSSRTYDNLEDQELNNDNTQHGLQRSSALGKIEINKVNSTSIVHAASEALICNDGAKFVDLKCGSKEKRRLPLSIQSKNKSGAKRISAKELLKLFNPVRNFKIMLGALKELKYLRCGLALMLVMTFATISYFGDASIQILYLKAHPFYFTAKNLGFFLAFQSALVGLLGLVLFNWILQTFFKLSDIVMLLVSSTACIPYFILMGAANSTVMLYSVQILHAVCTLNTPTIRSLLSKMVKPASVGAIMGAVGMVETFAILIGGLAIPVSYAGLLPLYSGAIYFLLAAVMLLTVGIISICAYVFPKNIAEQENIELNT